jgi:hypothetical protein
MERLLQGPIEGLGVNSHLIARGRCRPPIKKLWAGLENVVGCVRLRYLASFIQRLGMNRTWGCGLQRAEGHQPTNIAPIYAVRARQPRPLQVSCFEPAQRAYGSQTVALRRGFLPLRLSWSFLRVYITARLPEVAPDNAKGRDVVAHVVPCVCGLRRKEHRVHFRFHRARQSYGGPTAGGAR